MRNTFYITVIILLSSCVKDVPIDAEYLQSKLVMHGLANPDSIWKIHISKSASLYMKDEVKYINNAEVKIRDSRNNIIENLVHQGKGYYVSANRPLAGEIYHLDVSCDGFHSVSSRVEVPEKPEFTCDTAWIKKNGKLHLELTYSIMDNADSDNYYIIQAQIVDRNSDGQVHLKNIWMSTHDQHIDNREDDIDARTTGHTFMLLDDHFNGQFYQVTFDIGLEEDNPGWFNSPFNNLKVSVANCNKALYRHMGTLSLYHSTDGNPFANPVQVYSNIENGFGLLGSWNQSDSIFQVFNYTY